MQNFLLAGTDLGSQPEGRQRTLATNRIDLQRLLQSRREALLAFGTNLGQKSIFSLRFQASPSQTIHPTCLPHRAHPLVIVCV